MRWYWVHSKWPVKDRQTNLASFGRCLFFAVFFFGCSIIYRSFIVFLFRAFCTFIPHELRYGTNERQLPSTNSLLNDSFLEKKKSFTHTKRYWEGCNAQHITIIVGVRVIADEKMLMLFMTCSRLCALATWMHVNVLMVSQQTNFYLFIQMIHIIDNVKWIFGFYCAISRWSGKQKKQRVREELKEETTPPSLPARLDQKMQSTKMMLEQISQIKYTISMC